MKRIFLLAFFVMSTIIVFAQGSLHGTIFDKQKDEPLGFVTIQILNRDQSKAVVGVITDVEGKFRINDLAYGDYTLKVTYVGYKELVRDFSVTKEKPEEHFTRLFLSEDPHLLKEVQVTGQKSAMKLEVDRKTFDVSQLISTSGKAASDVLDNIPSVEVDNDGNISLRGNSSVEVWINGKASGLTADNRATILQQIPAESIEKIEVIDNPSAKYSAEGSAGIINIVLKKNRKAGYYGSVQVGADTRGGANTGVNINYSSSKLDAYGNVGYRHMSQIGYSESEQINYAYGNPSSFQNYKAEDRRWGNGGMSRAGVTYHMTEKDDISLSGMFMGGGQENRNVTPYVYANSIAGVPYVTNTLTRNTYGTGDMRAINTEFDYTHKFAEQHKIDFNFEFSNWRMNNHSFYRDINDYNYNLVTKPYEYSWQYRPMNIRNYSMEGKIDYENQITENFKVEAGYNWDFSHENTPQKSYETSSTNGIEPDVFNSVDPSADYSAYEDHRYFNRFIYDMNVHALYFTANMKMGKLGLMAGLRGEYWNVNTESLDWDQEYSGKPKNNAFKKDYFQLFPSLFASYQLTENDQFQFNYSRRLQRPWGGQLNSFRDTRDATMISFGNPELTPEFSNSFAFNYLRTWTQHSLLLSLYYRPTTDVMQRISYRDAQEDILYSTFMNIAKSTSSGAELTVKNKFFRILDLTTNINVYNYKLNAFSYTINNQTITGEEQKRFTWNARMDASLSLPYDISVQLTGRYRSREAITQGTRLPSYALDLGVRKNFFNKLITVSLSCRDLLDSRRWRTETETDTFWRRQINRRAAREVSATVTWNFGNMKANKRDKKGPEQGQEPNQGYNTEGQEF